MEWYAISTKPRQERLAESSLRRLGLETFCPLLKQRKAIRNKWRTTVGLLFPGYQFARFDRASSYRAVNSAPGVRKVVTFGSVPARVEEAVIEAIKSRLKDNCAEVPPPVFKPRQAVRIHEGPFRGLAAVFEREMSHQQRAVLLLQLLSGQARVIVGLDQVTNL